jgi:hypothetical protein
MNWWTQWWSSPTSAWRTEVLLEVQGLEAEIERLTGSTKSSASVSQAREALARAKAAATEKRSPVAWWSGDQIERAWRAVQQAREDLQRAQGDHARLRTLEEHHFASNATRRSTRQLRNLLWILTAVLTVAAAIALGVDADHRTVILIGALAGALTGVLPLTSSTKLTGPYGVTSVQALLKIPAGAAAALLGVYLLGGGGIGPLGPAIGANATFYAVVFGLSQQALTSIADRQAESLAKT